MPIATYTPHANGYSGAIKIGDVSVAYVYRPGRARAVNVSYQCFRTGRVVVEQAADYAAACRRMEVVAGEREAYRARLS